MRKTNPHDVRTRTCENLKCYLLLIMLQTLGMLIIYWNAIPLYRIVEANPSGHVPQSKTLIWAFLGIMLMQVPYWVCRRAVPTLPKIGSSHPIALVLLFVAHLVFDVAVIFFAFMFIDQPAGFQVPTSRYALTIIAFFSLFCYSLELEHFGKTFMEPGQRPNVSMPSGC